MAKFMLRRPTKVEGKRKMVCGILWEMFYLQNVHFCWRFAENKVVITPMCMNADAKNHMPSTDIFSLECCWHDDITEKISWPAWKIMFTTIYSYFIGHQGLEISLRVRLGGQRGGCVCVQVPLFAHFKQVKKLLISTPGPVSLVNTVKLNISYFVFHS